MKYTTALAVAAAVTGQAQASCQNEGGNFFCAAVKALKYDGLDIAGKYQAVSAMKDDGTCDFKDVDYSGPIAPFDEDLSVHFRGPIQLQTFAVYYPKASKKREEPRLLSKRHGHHHLHKKFHDHHKVDERAVGDVVNAVINGQEVSWKNTWAGGDAPAPAPAASSPEVKAPAVNAAFVKSDKPSPKTSPVPHSGAVSDFERVAYYCADQADEATGVTFLGHYGGAGAGSGVWDTTFGSSLSYISEDATQGAASPTVLKKTLVPDNTEFAIFSDKQCSDSDASCGFYREGSVAYEGFKGADKVMLFEFSMPMSGKTGFNADMPSLWLLNGKIPRTQQYGNCSCWGGIGKGGCGEFDIVEVLASGDTKCKSTFHYTNSIGNSDYIDRPTDKTMKLAVVFQSSSSSASIKVLDSDFDISSGLTSDQVESMVADHERPGLFSLMAIPSH